jgi:predicted transcriptional regulator
MYRDVPDTPSSHPGMPLFPISMLLFGGYRRISRKNVLEHDARRIIYTTITRHPGIDVKYLAGLTGINENTLRYHLVKLVETGKVTYFVRPGVVRFFPNQGAYSACERVLIHYLRTETPGEILRLLYQSPGMTRQQISDALAIAGPSVTRQMEHLIDDQVVENRFPARSNHYYLTDETITNFTRLMSDATSAWWEETPGKALPHSCQAGIPELSAVQSQKIPRIPGM